MSFKLANLLLGAPIRQAAIRQKEVAEYERKINSRRPAGESGQQQEVDDLLEASDLVAYAENVGPANVAADQDQLIDPVECMERLDRANNEQQQGPNSTSDMFWPAEDGATAATTGTGLQFEVFDLYANGESLGSFGIHESLELLVEPSSVRALKLVEK